jgi:hypothetical protein
MNIRMEINAVNVDLRLHHRLGLYLPVPVVAIPIILKIRIAPTKYAHYAHRIPILKWQQVQLQQNKKLAHVKKITTVN